jgi:hypothetical protein
VYYANIPTPVAGTRVVGVGTYGYTLDDTGAVTGMVESRGTGAVTRVVTGVAGSAAENREITALDRLRGGYRIYRRFRLFCVKMPIFPVVFVLNVQ